MGREHLARPVHGFRRFTALRGQISDSLALVIACERRMVLGFERPCDDVESV